MSQDHDDYIRLMTHVSYVEQFRIWAYGCTKHRYCMYRRLPEHLIFVCYTCGTRKKVSRSVWLYARVWKRKTVYIRGNRTFADNLRRIQEDIYGR